MRAERGHKKMNSISVLVQSLQYSMDLLNIIILSKI